jgi:hypothetical protein
MKSLQAFKSFLTGESFVEINSENWFVVGHTIRQRNWFAASTSISKVNTTSLQPTHFQQQMLIRCKQLNFDRESQFHYSQYTFGKEC